MDEEGGGRTRDEEEEGRGGERREEEGGGTDEQKGGRRTLRWGGAVVAPRPPGPKHAAPTWRVRPESSTTYPSFAVKAIHSPHGESANLPHEVVRSFVRSFVRERTARGA